MNQIDTGSDSIRSENTTQKDEHVIHLVVETLDGELSAMDANLQWRLRQARSRAFNTSNTRKSRKRYWFDSLYGSQTVAAACCSVLGVVLAIITILPNSIVPADKTDSEIVNFDVPAASSNEDIDFYGSIDFLLWLEKQSV